MNADTAALSAIRDYLDRTMYTLVDHRIGLELPGNLTGFPRYDPLRRIVQRLDPVHRSLFRLFRLGEAVEEVPDGIRSAAIAAGLVEHTTAGWRTPGLLIVPAHGLLLVTGIPDAYPTASSQPKAVFDISTSFVAAAMPRRVHGRVLDVCSGTGVQALLAATRGADEVVGLELRESAVAIATVNAALNGLSDRVSFRVSDMLSALTTGEQFDFVVANLPYLPAVGVRPTKAAEVGTSLVWSLLDALPRHLTADAHGVVATWRAAGLDGETYQLRAIAERLAQHGRSVSAYVDPVHIGVDGILKEIGVSHVDSAREVFARAEIDGFYNQLVHFGPGVAEPVRFGLGRVVNASRVPVGSSAR
jgi:16S rRNA G966 N2-methylase RsmD